MKTVDWIKINNGGLFGVWYTSFSFLTFCEKFSATSSLKLRNSLSIFISMCLLQKKELLKMSSKSKTQKNIDKKNSTFSPFSI